MNEVLNHFQLLSHCTEVELELICERRHITIPIRWKDRPDGLKSLIKSMIYHLEDHHHLSGVLASLQESELIALKHLTQGHQPPISIVPALFSLGLILPVTAQHRDVWILSERVRAALDDFDDSALSLQAPVGTQLNHSGSFRFSLALVVILLRCVHGVRVLKAGLPAKKELDHITRNNTLFSATLSGEEDASLLFTLLHRLGLLWQREGRVETLIPAVLAHPPRWIAERTFSYLVEHDLDAWQMPMSEDRIFFLQHLLDRPKQIVKVDIFLHFLGTLRQFDAQKIREQFIPFLYRMGLLDMDLNGHFLALSEHGLALTEEYIHRNPSSTRAHWALFEAAQDLVIQPNLEILTPLLQNPHRLLRLAEISSLESVDTLANFKLSHDSIIKAVDLGLTIGEIRDTLGLKVPSTVADLLTDLDRRIGEVEIKQNARLIETKTPELAKEIMVRPEFISLGLKQIGPNLIEVHGQGNINTFLKEAGYLPKPSRFLPLSIDAQEDLYLWSLAGLAFIDEKGLNHHLDPIRQMIRQSLQQIHDENPSLFQQIQRRIPMLHLSGEQQPMEETRGILDYATIHNLAVEVTYLPPAAHRTQLRRLSPKSIEEDTLVAFCHLHQEDMVFRLKRIHGVRLLNEKGWNRDTPQVG